MSNPILTNAQLTALTTNLTSHSPTTAFVIGGKSLAPSDIVSLGETVLVARAAVTAAAGKLKDARTSAATAEAQAFPTLTEVRGQLVSMLGNDTATMAILGVSPKKARAALAPEDRLVATEKLRATRVARGTMGPKAKAKVKGNVAGIQVTTLTTPAPVASPSTSATVAVATAPAVAGH